MSEIYQLLSLAREVGAKVLNYFSMGLNERYRLEIDNEQLTAFAERIRQDERERCARICDDMGKDACGPDGEPNCVWSAAYKHVSDEISAAIRSSGTSGSKGEADE